MTDNFAILVDQSCMDLARSIRALQSLNGNKAKRNSWAKEISRRRQSHWFSHGREKVKEILEGSPFVCSALFEFEPPILSSLSPHLYYSRLMRHSKPWKLWHWKTWCLSLTLKTPLSCPFQSLSLSLSPLLHSLTMSVDGDRDVDLDSLPFPIPPSFLGFTITIFLLCNSKSTFYLTLKYNFSQLWLISWPLNQ